MALHGIEKIASLPEKERVKLFVATVDEMTFQESAGQIRFESDYCVCVNKGE